MARRISASVGRMGGVNRPDDVKTVQELLNQVPPGSGGPKPPLAVDGICGPKTINAIQTFQLHHFGWKGADGRVDPGGPTLEKLNEYDVAKQQPHLLSIRCVLEPGRFLDLRRPEHWFFEVTEAEKGVRAIYHLSGDFEHPPVYVPGVFLGGIETFRSVHPASALETRGAGYKTLYDLSWDPDKGRPEKLRPIFSKLLMYVPSQPSQPGQSMALEKIDIVYPAHIEPPVLPDMDDSPLPPRWEHTGLGGLPYTISSKRGRFNLVRSLQR